MVGVAAAAAVRAWSVQAGRGANADAGQRTSLERQQRELFEVIRDKVHQDSVTRAETRDRAGSGIKALTLGAGERIASLSVSPNGRGLLITTTIPNDRALATRVPNYVTESGYTEDIPGRTKVGDFQSGGRVAYMSLPSGDVHFLKLASDTSTLANARVVGWSEAGGGGARLLHQRRLQESLAAHRDGGFGNAQARRHAARQRVGRRSVLRLRAAGTTADALLLRLRSRRLRAPLHDDAPTAATDASSRAASGK